MNEQVERIIARIERLKDENGIGLSEYDAGYCNAVGETCDKILSFIRSMSEGHNDSLVDSHNDNVEPASDCLDNAAKEILSGFGCIATTDKGVRLFDEDGMLTICKAGANWQKRQMMKNCAVGYVIARNKNCLHPLRIYDNIPQRHECTDGRAFWMGNDIRLPDTLFPEITWEDEPQEVELIIIKE